MTRIAFLLALALTFACGAPGYDEPIEGEFNDEAELGQLEQGILYIDGATTQVGTQTGSDRRACKKNSPGQVCSVPTFKALEVAYAPAQWTATQQTAFQDVVNALAITYGNDGWSFTLVDQANTPGAGKVRLLVQRSGSGGGDNSDNVKNYALPITMHSTNFITEGQHGAGTVAPIGQYQTHGSCSTTVYPVRIDAKVSNAGDRLRLLRHGLGNTAVQCMGVGTRTDVAGFAFYSSATISPTFTFSAGTTGEQCRMGGMSEMNDLADISRVTASVCAGD